VPIEENKAVAGRCLAEFRGRDFNGSTPGLMAAITMPVRPGSAAEHFRMGRK
jgi:hypothetical protein